MRQPEFRYDISEESALRIVNHILFLFGNMVLGIQHEMVVGERSLNKTRDGEGLPKDMSAERAKHEKNLADAKRSHEEAMQSGKL